MKEIQSTKNSFVKEIKKLDKRKYREEKQLYKIEGYHLIEEAIKANAEIVAILFTEDGKEQVVSYGKLEEDTLFLITSEVLEAITTTPTPQGVVAVIKMPQEETVTEYFGPLLLLDNVQDPGNVGTMIRTADAANFQGVVLGEGCADIYSSKVLRSMQGSQFHLTITRASLGATMDVLKENNIPVYGTELNPQAIDYRKVTPKKLFGLLMGNEGQGVQAALLQQTDANLYIPIEGRAESLNVAVAAGILMFSLV